MISFNPDLLDQPKEPRPGGTESHLYPITAGPPTVEEVEELGWSVGIAVIVLRKVSFDTPRSSHHLVRTRNLMQTFTVITPVLEARATFLTDTYESVASQRLPRGWNLQWVVQADANSRKSLKQLPSKKWISKGTADSGEASHMRTHALSRVAGILIRALDADHLFPDEETLARDVRALANNPDTAWTVAPVLDLYPSGLRVTEPCDLEPGRVPRAHLAHKLRRGHLPISGTTFTAYTTLLVGQGGWPAVPGIEEVGPLLAAEAVADGWMQEQPGEVNRVGPSQQAPGAAYSDDMTSTVLALDRADSLRRLGWRWRPPRPVTV